MILATAAAAVYMRRRGLGLRYLDSVAAGLPLGILIGRFGDLINGEHYGPASDLPWAVRNSHPNADMPSSDIAHHSGVPLRDGSRPDPAGRDLAAPAPLPAPGMLLWTVVAMCSAGRFAMFFYRGDSERVALGLNSGQWTSLVLVGIAAIGISAALDRRPAPLARREAADRGA